MDQSKYDDAGFGRLCTSLFDLGGKRAKEGEEWLVVWYMAGSGVLVLIW